MITSFWTYKKVNFKQLPSSIESEIKVKAMDIQKSILLALSVLIIESIALPEYHKVVGHFGDAVNAYEDVMIDEEAQLIIATVAKVSAQNVTPSIAFHDYSVGYSVIKIVEEGVCFIEKTRHSMEYLKEILNQADKDDGNYEIRQAFKCKSMTFVEPSGLSVYGERIAAFCKDYESFYVEKEYKMRSKKETLDLNDKSVWCFICGGRCPAALDH